MIVGGCNMYFSSIVPLVANPDRLAQLRAYVKRSTTKYSVPTGNGPEQVRAREETLGRNHSTRTREAQDVGEQYRTKNAEGWIEARDRFQQKGESRRVRPVSKPA